MEKFLFTGPGAFAQKYVIFWDEGLCFDEQFNFSILSGFCYEQVGFWNSGFCGMEQM